MRYGNLKDKTLAEQASAIRVKYKGYSVSSTHLYLKVLGSIQPTPRSSTYSFELRYYLNDKKPLQVNILSPSLEKNFRGDKIPHVYPGDRLCLFMPKYREFKKRDFISDTIIPWTSLWLYHYEVWHMTGDWMGGGEHPSSN